MFAREVSFVEEENDRMKTNQIFWMGISVKHLFTKTPLGGGRLQMIC